MKMSHGVEYAAFWVLTKFIQIIPGWLADKIAGGLGRIAFWILKSRRAIARDNLIRAFKGEMPEEEIVRITKTVFGNIARDLIEFMRQPVIGLEKINSYIVERKGIEHLKTALDGGRGMMLVTGHIGNGELLGWVSTMYPTDFVVGVQHNPYVNNMFTSFRAVFNATAIPVGLTSRHVIKSLKENRIVVLMSDQHSATGGTVVNFFDRPASTPKGPAAFAVKVGCPIIFAVVLREKYNRFRAIFNPPIYPPNSGDKEKDVHWMTQKYTSELEEFIRQYPDQWMWTHRRWKLD